MTVVAFRRALVVGVLVALYWWAWRGAQVVPADVVEGFPYMLDFLARTFPPDPSVIGRSTAAIIETIHITILGTTLGALLALPMAFVSAKNLGPSWMTAPARVVLAVTRTVPSILWAVLFVAAVGLGPLAGVLALTFYSTGMLGKLYYESLERIKPSSLDAIVATGFEYNIRHASVLGLVGAGGIGFDLLLYVRSFQYDKLATALIVLYRQTRRERREHLRLLAMMPVVSPAAIGTSAGTEEGRVNWTMMFEWMGS